MKQKLLSAPTLGWPDPEQPFELFVHEQDRMALGWGSGSEDWQLVKVHCLSVEVAGHSDKRQAFAFASNGGHCVGAKGRALVFKCFAE